jgi:thiamine pyrophosphate-dependent acetolactate synthase large subunit-like protein
VDRAVPTGADILVEQLYRHGVRDVFGMPGSHSVAIYDAIVRRGGIRTILSRNEQAGAFMADGYARVTGRPGVICTTAGPGATNALSGVAEAFADGVPVLLITGQVNHDRLHQECGAYHEIDLEGIFRACTKYAATVIANEQIPQVTAKAFEALTTGRRRSATLILPQDLMAKECERNHPPSGDPSLVQRESSTLELRQEIDHAAQLLSTYRRPIILAGGGAVWSDAGPEIRLLAERLRCPVITSLNGKGIIDERNPLSLGHARSIRAKAALPHADLMLAIGCRFTEVLTWFHTLPIPQELIQIDIDPVQIGMNYPVRVGIVADAKEALRAILDKLPERSASDWGELLEQASKLRHPQPEWFIERLRAELPDDGIVFTDACEMGLRMHTDFPAYAPRTFFYPSNYIALGWALPAAIGAAVAMPDRPVVSVSGDGGFLMTAQELATAVRYRLKLAVIVHNDSAYGAIRNLQRARHEARYVDTDLNNPNFVKFAESFGVPATRAADAEAFSAALCSALNRSGPSLIEVPDQWRSLRVSTSPSKKGR